MKGGDRLLYMEEEGKQRGGEPLFEQKSQNIM